MVDELIKSALAGDAGRARDTARTLSDPSRLPEFRAALARRKLSPVERKLLYEFLEYLARNSKSPEVAAFLLERLAVEKQEATQLLILGTLRLLEGLDCAAIEPFLTSGGVRVRHAALQALRACVGDRPVHLLVEALRQSQSGEETRQCADTLASVGDKAAADAVFEKLDTIERSRLNVLAVTYLLVAAYALAGERHRDKIRGELGRASHVVDRWLIVSAICRLGTADDCELVEAEIGDYLRKPTGPINLLTGHARIRFPTAFQAGMSFLKRTCPERFERLSTRALDVDLPQEDRVFLEGILKYGGQGGN